MRRIMTLITVSLFSQTAWANCANQHSPDLKAYCFARESGRASDCNPIGDINLRITCMAEMSKDARRCGSIRDMAKQDECYVNVERVKNAAAEPEPEPAAPAPAPAHHGTTSTHSTPASSGHHGTSTHQSTPSPRPAADPSGRGTKFQFDLYNPGDCNSVTDANQKYLCQGLSQRNEQLCFPLNHIDFRYLCTAVLRKESQFCMNIRESSVKETCRAMAR